MSKRLKNSSAHSIQQNGIFPLLMKRIYLLIPLVIFLVASLVLRTSINKENQSSELACGTQDLSGAFLDNEKFAYFEGKQIAAPSSIPSFLSKSEINQSVLGETTSSERWIEVDLSEQKLIAHDGDSVFLETPVSTGLPWFPTPAGEFYVWSKVRAQKMSGGEGSSYYYLPNVPYVMFFSNDQTPKMKGFSLHGAYWHNDFGKQKSHGCVNLPIPIAEKLYYWVAPVLGEGKNMVSATNTNPGTRVIIHE